MGRAVDPEVTDLAPPVVNRVDRAVELQRALKVAEAQDVVEVEIASAEADWGLPPAKAFTRQHIQELHDAGMTRPEAEDYIRGVLGAQRAAGAIRDLDSYGDWNG